MRPILFIALLLFSRALVAQTPDSITAYNKTTVMIPMRDGVKLFTTIYTPFGASTPVPFLIQRTPYGALNVDDPQAMFKIFYTAIMAREGYIFVYQDCRGKYKSEGKMEIHQPIISVKNPSAVDESTDTYDTIDWLLKNVPGNNGKAGLHGISYPGWLAMVGAINPHPALKASSPQAQMGDLFLGDDFHHNGAFRLSYSMEYTYEVEGTNADGNFYFPQYDLYDWYLKLGSLKNVNDRYFKDSIPTWNRFISHPNYDSFWQANSPLAYMKNAQIPLLHVGGYFDQEDLMGPQLMYGQLEKTDKAKQNFICLGPWNHGQWAGAKADSLGKITFDSKTAVWFQTLQKHWFDYWLKGIGTNDFAEANCFQTGSNTWQSFETWPPKAVDIKKLYATASGGVSFEKPTAKTGAVSYTSDPAKPVPYRLPPIEATYGPGSRWKSWQVEDQRFVYSRPDVISFTGDSLTEDLAVTGNIVAHLMASTTGADADWVVKLIDVYPNFDQKSMAMSGYQLPVAMEVFRGRYRKSFEKPQPLTPNKPEEFVIDLHQINHLFKAGHKLMIQIQSSWFPVIDRNPQTWVPNIFEAKDGDFKKEQHSIYCNALQSTYLELPVMPLKQ